mmetsp:Transcript_18263/g.42280  ORF Transcript_18263/g.42280 Transcript_18263/m.42280 type:complete len:156 (+) Transcript_18263:16-483(+)
MVLDAFSSALLRKADTIAAHVLSNQLMEKELLQLQMEQLLENLQGLEEPPTDLSEVSSGAEQLPHVLSLPESASSAYVSLESSGERTLDPLQETSTEEALSHHTLPSIDDTEGISADNKTDRPAASAVSTQEDDQTGIPRSVSGTQRHDENHFRN